MDSVGYDEMRRIIREEDSPKPSTRLSTLGDTLSTVAVSRRIEPMQLASAIRGDLDWVAMKALEKDRNRRYESAAAMAADIKPFLHSEPIDARPPSRIYQFEKFAKRHHIAIVTASLDTFSLLIGTAFCLCKCRWRLNNAT